MRSIIPKTMRSLTFFFMATLASIGAAQEVERQAIDVSSLGPQVGDEAPDFRLPDQFGNYHTLNDVMGSNGVMLLFHRSADW